MSSAFLIQRRARTFLQISFLLFTFLRRRCILDTQGDDFLKTPRTKLLLQLFLSTFYISAFTFGGGFVIVTFMKRRFVDEYGWISKQEMLDYTALAQSAPGPIAVNAAILVGWRVAGLVLGLLGL